MTPAYAPVACEERMYRPEQAEAPVWGTVLALHMTHGNSEAVRYGARRNATSLSHQGGVTPASGSGETGSPRSHVTSRPMRK